MARRRNPKKKDETLVDLGEASGQVQDFFEANQNTIIGVLLGLVIAIGGIYAYNNFYKKPQQMEAVRLMSKAQQQFERDSFALALENPGDGGMGFLQIIDNYGGSDVGNLAHYYAGVSWLNLGKYDAAIAYLKDFNPSGEITPIMKFGVMGDAYSEMGKTDDAISHYKKAANAKDNQFLSAYYLKKLGLLQQYNGNLEASKEAYQEIKDKYPDSPEARDIDKFISRVDNN
ncbi:MAG: tetratricopeptide repeat protein [Bacteroidota bacterium]